MSKSVSIPYFRQSEASIAKKVRILNKSIKHVSISILARKPAAKTIKLLRIKLLKCWIQFYMFKSLFKQIVSITKQAVQITLEAALSIINFSKYKSSKS